MLSIGWIPWLLILVVLVLVDFSLGFLQSPHRQKNILAVRVPNQVKSTALHNQLNSPSTVKLPDSSINYYWNLNKVAFSLLPLAPGARRKTIVEEVVKNEIWTLDQLQGVVNVNVPVRSTVIKLKEGGLFVYNPVAPTKECLTIMKSLELAYGPVKYIVLGSLGLEHKALAASFCQFFQGAELFLQPGQWSFPVDLPNSFLGFPINQKITELPIHNSGMPNKNKSTPPSLLPSWAIEFDFAVLDKLKFKSVGGYGETAIFHKRTQTLLVTDAVISVPDEPPSIIAEDPRALLYHSRDAMLDEVQDNRDSRLRGWRRMTIFSLFFYPSGISISNFFLAFQMLGKVSANSKLLGKGSIPISGGLYPWSWTANEESSFKALQGGLLVAPILQQLIMNREPKRVLMWADKIAQWPIKRIIPCHFQNNIAANGKDFRRAFSCLETNPTCPKPFAGDFFLLEQLSKIFTSLGVVAAPEPPVPSEIPRPAQLTLTTSFLQNLKLF